MGLLSGLTKAAGSLLGGDTIKDVGNIIDNLHTSGEEKEEARQKITQILATAEQAAQAQARHGRDRRHPARACRPPLGSTSAARILGLCQTERSVRLPV